MSSPSQAMSDDELRSLLLAAQKDPKSVAVTLPSLTKPQLLSLFGVFVEDEDSKDKLALRSSAYLALSSFVSTLRSPTGSGSTTEESSADATKKLVAAFTPTIEDALNGTKTDQILASLSFLSALFQVDPPSAASIFQREGIFDSIVDIIDLIQALPTNISTNANSKGVQPVRLQRALAIWFSHAFGTSECRKYVNGLENKRGVRWLKSQVSSSDTRIRAVSALALTKLAQGSLQDAEAAQSGIPVATSGEVSGVDTSASELAKLLEQVVITESKPNNQAVLDSIEGLAYLSTKPEIKEYIVSEAPLLKKLFAIGSSATQKLKYSNSNSLPDTDPRLNVGLHYGLALILSNLCQYQKRLSKEEEQIARLRRMTKVSSETADKEGRPKKMEDAGDDPRESDAAVKVRVKKLCSTGLLPVLAGLSRSESQTARYCTAKTYLSVVEDQSNRGAVLQSGGAKALLNLIKPSPTSTSSTSNSGKATIIPDWNAVQALSKLAITAPPIQVFGPDSGATIDAMGYFASVLTISEAASSTAPLKLTPRDDQLPNPLQRFEAMMALTNIASLGPQYASRMMAIPRLFNAVESLLLDENELTRRAATELICNFIICDEGFERYVPNSSPKVTSSVAESRLQILVALSDVEDLQTRKAASGALAMLSSEESVCAALVSLQKKRGSLASILARLLVDDEDEEEDQNKELEDANSTVTTTTATPTSPSSKQNKQLQKGKQLDRPTPKIADGELVHRGLVVLRNLVVNFLEKQKGKESGNSEAKDFVQALENAEVVQKVEMVVKDVLQRQAQAKARPQGANGDSSPLIKAAMEFGVGLQKFANES